MTKVSVSNAFDYLDIGNKAIISHEHFLAFSTI
jgi:hypothetical protein